MSPNQTLILLLHQAQQGLFPIDRQLAWIPYRRSDSCIFGAASIARILVDIQPLLTATDQALAQQIRERIAAHYPLYHHPSRPGTFNFWKQPFPNGYLLHRFRHFHLPADIDDTALILSTGTFSRDHHQRVYQTAQDHTEIGRQRQGWPVRPSFYRPVRDQEWIYQTWFGVKMPLEFDLCALCNWMTWVSEQGFYGQSPADQASVRFLLEVLHSTEWIEQAPQVARHYGRPAWIAYYAARWITAARKKGWQGNITPFLQILENQLSEESTPDQLLFHLAWYKLGGVPQKTLNLSPTAWDHFPLFLGNLLAPFGPFWAKQPWANMYWTSAANGLALHLEYQLWLAQAHRFHPT